MEALKADVLGDEKRFFFHFGRVTIRQKHLHHPDWICRSTSLHKTLPAHLPASYSSLQEIFISFFISKWKFKSMSSTYSSQDPGAAGTRWATTYPTECMPSEGKRRNWSIYFEIAYKSEMRKRVQRNLEKDCKTRLAFQEFSRRAMSFPIFFFVSACFARCRH